jgi:hypothetical protein
LIYLAARALGYKSFQHISSRITPAYPNSITQFHITDIDFGMPVIIVYFAPKMRSRGTSLKELAKSYNTVCPAVTHMMSENRHLTGRVNKRQIEQLDLISKEERTNQILSAKEGFGSRIG